MRRNNGAQKGEAICEGRGESMRPERRYRKARSRRRGEKNHVIIHKTVSHEV